MQLFFLDLKADSWIDTENHGVLLVIAVASLLALVGIFIYRKRKNSK